MTEGEDVSESLETSAADDLASDIWNPDGVARYEDISIAGPDIDIGAIGVRSPGAMPQNIVGD